jgi:xanthine dehydrogenase YagT iron-sulfur-binding subunit
MEVSLTINGQTHTVDAPPHWTLLRVLRETLGLTGPREACGIGMCGSCTVLIDGKAMTACLLLVPQAVGKQIITIEGLPTGDQLHPVQQAFYDHHAFQCSYCTPGFIMASVALLQETSQPSDEEIREYLGGNLCRCGAYPEILAAVRDLTGRAKAL